MKQKRRLAALILTVCLLFYYKIMDPGNQKTGASTILSLSLPSPDSTKFVYNSPNGYKYYDWVCRMY